MHNQILLLSFHIKMMTVLAVDLEGFMKLLVRLVSIYIFKISILLAQGYKEIYMAVADP